MKQPSLWQIFIVFFRIGAFTFGGGYAMLPLIHRELGANHGWLSDAELVDMLAITQSAPGPIAINAASFAGYKLRGAPGAALAVLGATIPSLVTILVIAELLLSYRHLDFLGAVLKGLRPAVLGLILASALNLGQKSLSGFTDVLALVLAIAGLLALRLHPILVIVLAGAAGVWLGLDKRSKRCTGTR